MSKQDQLLDRLLKNEITRDEYTRLLAEAQQKPIYFKVSEKRAVSVYGLQRLPTTLYKAQWKRLLAKKDELLEFIDENDSRLAEKEAA